MLNGPQLTTYYQIYKYLCNFGRNFANIIECLPTSCTMDKRNENVV